MKHKPLLRAIVCFLLFFTIACNNLQEDSSHNDADVKASKAVSFSYTSGSSHVFEVTEDTQTVMLSGDIAGKQLYLVKANPTDSAMDVDFIFSLADQIRHNNDYPFQLYSATIPASTDMIDGVSYVIADEKGVKDLMKVFLAGGDVGSQSSGVEGVLKDEEEAGSETGTASSSASSIISSSSSYGSSASSGYQTRSSTSSASSSPASAA